MPATPAPAGSQQAPPVGETDREVFALRSAWRVHPQVAVRDEPFGALLYHFHTRKLSFLKNRTIVGIVRDLENHPSAIAACEAAGIDMTDGNTARLYQHALSVLASSQMITPAIAPEVSA